MPSPRADELGLARDVLDGAADLRLAAHSPMHRKRLTRDRLNAIAARAERLAELVLELGR